MCRFLDLYMPYGWIFGYIYNLQFNIRCIYVLQVNFGPMPCRPILWYIYASQVDFFFLGGAVYCAWQVNSGVYHCPAGQFLDISMRLGLHMCAAGQFWVYICHTPQFLGFICALDVSLFRAHLCPTGQFWWISWPWCHSFGVYLCLMVQFLWYIYASLVNLLWSIYALQVTSGEYLDPEVILLGSIYA